MGSGYWGGQCFGFMWIIPLLFFVVFLFFIRGMFRQGKGESINNHGESASEILDKRFAKGEITKEEYEEMKKTLDRF